MNTSLLEKYSNRQQLVSALLQQQVVSNNTTLAEQLADIVQLQHLAQGADLIVKGDPDTLLFLILAGRFSIVVNTRELAIRSAHTHIGEIASLDPSQRRTATVTALDESVVASITSQQLEKVGAQFPEVYRIIALELASRLSQRNKCVTMPNPRPVVFIGSSTQSAKYARAIQKKIEGPNITTRLWTESDLKPSITTIETLEVEISRCDFGVLVCGQDDVQATGWKLAKAPHDNIIFTLGICMGLLGRARCFLLVDQAKKINIPTDLQGVASIEFQSTGQVDADIAAACGTILLSVNRLKVK